MGSVTALPVALRAAKFIPLRKGTKVPAVEKADLEHAARWDETTDPWLAQGNRVGIYMAGLYVGLDADIKPKWEDDGNGGQVLTMKNGNDNVRALLAKAGIAELPRTLKVRTQGGGMHWYFRQNPAFRVTQGTIDCLDIRAHPNSYLAIGEGYEVLDDGGGQIAELPVELARAIMASKRGELVGKDDSGVSLNGHGDKAGYGDYSTAFNSALTSLKGMMLRLGWPVDEADNAIRAINAQAPDPIPDEHLEGTVLRPKNWESGEMLSDTMVEAFRNMVRGASALSADSIFEKWLEDPQHQRVALDIWFRKWVSDKLKQPPVLEESTWDEIDLGPLLGDKAEDPIIPDTLMREDGQGLCYTGSTLWVWGEPGHGKTVLCLLWAAQLIKWQRHVFWLDFESQLPQTVQKMLTIFGCTKDELREYFHARQPNNRLEPAERAKFLKDIDHVRPALVVIDACNDLLNLQGGRHNDVDTIADIDQQIIQPCKKLGASVAVIDHVAKSEEARGWPINSGHKKAVTDVGLQVRRVAAFTRDTPGYAKITCHKDRNGTFPDGTVVGYLVVANGKAWLTGSPPLGMMSQALAAGPQQLEITDGRKLKSQDDERKFAILQSVSEERLTLGQHCKKLERLDKPGWSAKSLSRTGDALLQQPGGELYLADDGCLVLG